MVAGVATCGSTGTVSGSRFANHVCNGGSKRRFALVDGSVLLFQRFSSFPAQIVDYQGFWKTFRGKIIMEMVRMGENREET